MSILGIHHLTAVCSDAQRTVDFYTHTLGFRLVKQTVNFDDPGSYHLYFGDESGHPGTLLTFFEWKHLPQGNWGIGTTHHAALIVETMEAQLKWKRWLTDRGIHVTGPYDRTYFRSIYFKDPDGLILEIATRMPGWTVDEHPDNLGHQLIEPPTELTRYGRNEEKIEATTWHAPVPVITADLRLKGIHHITAICSDLENTSAFYREVLGFSLVKRTLNYDDPSSHHYYFGIGAGAPGTIITYFGYKPHQMRAGRIGTGMTHHFAFAVKDEAEQLQWLEKLQKARVPVSPVMDRVYFKSIYFSDPDGHVLEIATVPPGFLVDEPQKSLGGSVMLPPWLEGQRSGIEKSLKPLTLNGHAESGQSESGYSGNVDAH